MGAMQKQYLFAGVVLIVLLGVAVVVYVASNKESAPPQEEASTDYVLDAVPLGTLKSLMPALDRETRFSDGTPESVRSLFQKKIDASVARLIEDPTRGFDWLNLALSYHGVGDYDGAREVWEFMTKVSPTDTVSFDNLGKLYHFTLKDFPKSESYFKQSIALNPYLINSYLDLFDLYRYSYKTETTAAADTLLQALTIFPDNLDIMVLLGGYYRDQGDTKRARESFQRALDIARSAGDMARMQSISAELVALP